MGHSGKRLVGNVDALCGIHGLGERFRDDDSNRLADISHGIAGQNRMGRDKEPGAVAIAQLHLVRVRRHRAVRYRGEAIARRIAAGQHREHTGAADRPGHINLRNRRVRVRRA